MQAPINVVVLLCVYRNRVLAVEVLLKTHRLIATAVVRERSETMHGIRFGLPRFVARGRISVACDMFGKKLAIIPEIWHPFPQGTVIPKMKAVLGRPRYVAACCIIYIALRSQFNLERSSENTINGPWPAAINDTIIRTQRIVS